MPLVSKTFSEIITFERATNASYFNSAGVLTNAAANAPRFDYNPSTLAAQGLLIEESRANQIRNNTMVGAVAGTPGTVPTNWAAQITTTTGLTISVIGTGTENGITYIDIRVNGTASGAGSLDVFLENANGVAALTGQTWTGSVYTKLQSGSLTGISTPTFRLYEYTSGIVFVTAQSGAIATPTTANLATQRTSATLTTTGGATTASIRPLINYAIANGAAIDITLRIGLPQLELGAFATSVIPTTTTALTRAADVASVNTLSPWYNATEGTLFAEAVYFGLSASTTVAANTIRFFDGTGSNAISLRTVIGTGSASADEVIVASGVTYMDTTGITATTNTTYKRAIAYSTNNARAAINGAYTDPADTTVTIPVVTSLSFGFAGSFYGMYLRRISYYPRKLSDAELQTLTT